MTRWGLWFFWFAERTLRVFRGLVMGYLARWWRKIWLVRGRGEPVAGRLLFPRKADVQRDYPSSGLVPNRLTAILQEADRGNLGRVMQLFEEMEEKDAHLFAVASKRRLALTGLSWSIVSADEYAEGVDRVKASEAAAYCREVLSELDSLDAVLQHLSLAMGRNVSVAELVWDVVRGSLRLVDVVPVDFGRLAFDELDALRILTSEEPERGIPVLPNKFIVHTPHSVSGHPGRGGLLRVTALNYMGKRLTVKDWLIYAEVFGMPVRIARYDSSATMEEKREILRMLESLGSKASGLFSKAVELQFVEAGQGKSPPPYSEVVEFLNREMSKAWLGQTLTTETPGLGGSYAATKIHEQVRKDLRADDIRKEGRTIRRDLLAPLARLKFGQDVPVPYFRRKMDRPRTVEELTNVLSGAVNSLGLQVPVKWAHEELGIPVPVGDEEVLSGSN